MDKEYVLVYTPYITRKGVRIWASQYSLEVFCLRIPSENYRGELIIKILFRHRILIFFVIERDG